MLNGYVKFDTTLGELLYIYFLKAVMASIGIYSQNIDSDYLYFSG